MCPRGQVCVRIDLRVLLHCGMLVPVSSLSENCLLSPFSLFSNILEKYF